MLRLADWKCDTCGELGEELVEVPRGESLPKQQELVCATCNAETTHTRQLALPAPYMGERPLNPRMFGGSFDTMGREAPPDLPELPGAVEHMQATATKLAELPADAGADARREVLRDMRATAPSSADFAAHFATREYREAEAQGRKVAQRNAGKRKRAAAMLRGEPVNMKRDRLPGDPNLAA